MRNPTHRPRFAGHRFAALFAVLLVLSGVARADKLDHFMSSAERAAGGEKIDVGLIALREVRAGTARASDPLVRSVADGLVVRGKDTGAIVLDVQLYEVTPAVKSALVAVPTATLVNLSEPYRQATVALEDLSYLLDLAAIEEVRYIRPEYGGMVLSSEARGDLPRTGSVNSRAPEALNVDLLAAQEGLTGSGQKVGVISDSAARTAGVRDANTTPAAGQSGTLMNSKPQDSGDLPPTVELLRDDNGIPNSGSSNIDEGAAMMELVHDVASGAALSFHTGFISQQVFAQGITALRNAGCTVIVDDLLFFAEPFYQPGIVAQAATAAVNAGIPYYSSAGNSGSNAIKRVYVDSNATDDLSFPASGNDFHNFSGGDRFVDVTLPPNTAFTASLHWNQPADVVGADSAGNPSADLGPGSQIDLDLYVYDSPSPLGTIVSASTASQGTTGSAFGNPFEIVAAQNTSGSTVNLYIAVDHYDGSQGSIPQDAATPVEFIIIFHSLSPTATVQYIGGPTVYGHAIAQGVSSVAAVPWFDTPRFNPGFSPSGVTDPESFTAQGGSLTMFFNAAGNFSPFTQFEPDITSVDGNDTTFFGSDVNLGGYEGEPNGRPNFFGTSAAAPNAAAVAALLRQARPNLSPAQINDALESTAIDITGTRAAPGDDNVTGPGLIHALNAFESLNDFVPVILNIGPLDPFPAQANQDEWVGRNWSDQVGFGVNNRWLFDGIPSTSGGALTITGGGSAGANTQSAFDPDTSFGIWDNFSDPAAEISPGNLTYVRANMGWEVAPANTSGSQQYEILDAFRLFANAPLVGQGGGTAGFSITTNMSLSATSLIDPDGDGTFTPNPTFPGAGVTRAFQITHDPLDSDFTQSGVQASPRADVGMDFVNAVGGGNPNFLTARLSAMDIAILSEFSYNSGASQVTAFGPGAGEQRFDGSDTGGVWEGWGVAQRGSFFGGTAAGDAPEDTNPILADIASVAFGAGSIMLTTNDQDLAANPSAVAFAEISQYAFFANSPSEPSPPGITNDINRVEVQGNAVYRFDFEQSVVSGLSDPGFKPQVVNQVGMPEPLNFKARSVITPASTAPGSETGTAFQTSSPETIPLYHTWLKQLAPGTVTGVAAGAEDDAQLVGGTLDFLGTDGTITYTGVRVFLLSSDDPHIEY